MVSPEQMARGGIDRLLTHAGWAVAGRRAKLNIHAARGVAIRDSARTRASASPTTCSTSTARPPA